MQKNFKITRNLQRLLRKKSFNKDKILLNFSETLMGSSSTIVSSTLSILSPSRGFSIVSSSALITSIAILITNDFFSKTKKRCTKLGNWINVLSLLYEKTLKQSMIEEKIDQKEAIALKKIFNYLDKRTDIMKNTQCKNKIVLHDNLRKESFHQIKELNHLMFKPKWCKYLFNFIHELF